MTLTHLEPQAVDYPAQYASGDPTGGRLVAWADALAAAHKIGAALCSTAFAPQHFKGKPDDAAAAVLLGDEIGLSPTQSLRSIFVISGTPGLYAKIMVALVMSKGHEVWTKSSTDEQVVVCGRRNGSSHVEEVSWTTTRARRAGYTSNKKYETDPQAMLYARAAGDVCRRIAPDALAGISNTVEELELEATPTPKRSVSRTKVTATVIPPEPDLEPIADVTDLPEAPPEKSERAKREGQMWSLFAETKHTEKADMLAFISTVVGRPITSRTDIDDEELASVIAELQLEKAGPPSDAGFEGAFPIGETT